MAAMMLCSIAGPFFIVFLFTQYCTSNVIEMDERFSNLRNEGNWLVEFYAPWCGYCKKLEPVWNEVGSTLHGSGVRVAKIDATRFSGISKEFGVRGFPTIKFVKGSRVITYQGDRTVQDIIQFTQRASSPAVRELSSAEELQQTKRDKSVFFLLVMSQDNKEHSEQLKNLYSEVAEKKVIESYFYIINSKKLSKAAQVTPPALLVHKDNTFFTYDAPQDVQEPNISSWVDSEKFSAFIELGRANFHDVTDTGKLLAFAVFAEDKEKKDQNKRLGKIVKNVALEYREKFRRRYQFGWLLGDSIANTIMMSSTTLPFLMVFDGDTHLYYMKYNTEIQEGFDEIKLGQFLEEIIEGRAQSYGGDSWFQRFRRGIWSMFSTLHEIWSAQPIVAALMVGLPSLVIGFLLYTLCTAETGDYEANSEEDEYYDEDFACEQQEASDASTPATKPKND